MTKSTILLVVAVIAVVGILLFGRRIRAGYGSLTPNGTITQRFQRYEVKDDLIYYTSGPDDIPFALIGIQRDLSLKSSLWKQRDMTPESMKRIVANMESKVSQFEGALHGYEICDQSGQYIGEWCSVPGIHTVIKRGKDDTVTMRPPPSDVYEHS
jgi:hypothetical protein